MYYYNDYIYVLPALILAMLAQGYISSVYKKYDSVFGARNITGAQAARMILDQNGLHHVRVERTSGTLTDHYDPRENVIRLSDAVHDKASVAAVGIAAHEAGHAVQHAKNYLPIQARNAIQPVASFSSQIAIPLIIIGLIFNSYFINFGIILFSAVVLFQIITLPVEFNASKRAVLAIENMGVLSREELDGTKKVLRAAAFTYVAAAAVSAMQLLRLIMLSNGRRRR